MDPFHQISSCDRNGCLPASEPALLQRDKGKNIFVGSAGERNDDVITAFFLPVAHHTSEPPDGWMVKETSLREAPEQIHQVIVTANMNQFMHQHGFHLSGRQTRQQSDGQQNQRPEVAENHGHRGGAGLQEKHRP